MEMSSDTVNQDHVPSEQKSNDNNQTEIELEVRNENDTKSENTTNDIKNDVEHKSNDEEKQDNIQDALEKETKHHVAHPSIAALVNKDVTWKECLSPYHLLRLGIAGLIAMLVILTLFGIAFALNPNPCIIGQSDPDKFEVDSVYNRIIYCWQMSIFLIPIIKIFGHEWLWTSKKIKCTMIWGVIILFVLFIPSGVFPKNAIGAYTSFIIFIGVLFTVIYVFLLSGFYVFWLLFPFGVAAILLFIVLIIGSLIFEYGIRPDGDYFTISYTIYLLILQSVPMKFHLYSFPYKWGKCMTCCCNKNKSRQARNTDVSVADELSNTVLFWYSMVVITVVETFRMAGYTAVQDERDIDVFTGLYSFIFYNVIGEVLTRNAVLWEIIWQCILKKELPARTRVDAIYYGATNQGEFIPIWTLLLINTFNYGPTIECCRYRELRLSPIVNIFSNWWLIPVLLGIQFIQIILSELMVRFARCIKWYGMKNEKGEDPPRKVILVKVNLILMIWILIHCYICSLLAFDIDNGNRYRTVNVSIQNDHDLEQTMDLSTTMFFDFSSTIDMDQQYICT